MACRLFGGKELFESIMEQIWMNEQNIFVEGNESASVACNMATTWFWHQCVNIVLPDSLSHTGLAS